MCTPGRQARRPPPGRRPPRRRRRSRSDGRRASRSARAAASHGERASRRAARSPRRRSAFSPATTVAIRSDSLTRSSAAPRTSDSSDARGHGDRHQRQLVDQLGDLLRPEVAPPQRPPAAHGDVADELGPGLVGRANVDTRRPSAQQPHEREAGGVDARRPRGSARASGCSAAATSQADCGRRIPGHVERRTALVAPARSASVTRPSRRTGTPVQASIRSVWSRVGPGDVDLRLAGRAQPGEHGRAEQLGAGHRQPVRHGRQRRRDR